MRRLIAWIRSLNALAGNPGRAIRAASISRALGEDITEWEATGCTYGGCLDLTRVSLGAVVAMGGRATIMIGWRVPVKDGAGKMRFSVWNQLLELNRKGDGSWKLSG